MSIYAQTSGKDHKDQVAINGARYAKGHRESEYCSIHIIGDCILLIVNRELNEPTAEASRTEIDLSGFPVLSGVIDTREYLEFVLYLRLGAAAYRTHVEWGVDTERWLSHAAPGRKTVCGRG